MERAIGYARVSTEEQAQGVSVDAQAARIRAYCELAGIELVGIIVERGVSGPIALATRPGGLKLVKGIARGTATHVVAVKLDRLFRDSIDALEQVRAWDKRGVAVHLVDMGGQAINTRSAVGRMIFAMLAGFAEFECSLIAERTAAVLAHKKAHGEVYGPTPYGFDRQGDRLVGNRAELATVDRIRAQADAGESFRGIARQLNGEGVATKRGGRWHARGIAYLLRNNLYAQTAQGVA